VRVIGSQFVPMMRLATRILHTLRGRIIGKARHGRAPIRLR
jgi:hypothetical protein